MSMETKHGAGQPPSQNGANEGYERSDANRARTAAFGGVSDRL